LQCVAVCCSVLHCVAVCCSVLQCVAVCCSVLQCVTVCCSVLLCVAVCCSILRCVAVRCSVMQCVAVRCSVCPYVADIHNRRGRTNTYLCPSSVHCVDVQRLFPGVLFHNDICPSRLLWKSEKWVTWYEWVMSYVKESSRKWVMLRVSHVIYLSLLFHICLSLLLCLFWLLWKSQKWVMSYEWVMSYVTWLKSESRHIFRFTFSHMSLLTHTSLFTSVKESKVSHVVRLF